MLNLNYYKTALNSIYEISVILNSSENKRHALSGTLKLMQETLSMERGFLLLQDSHTLRLIVAASVGIPEYSGGSVNYETDEGVVGKVFRLGVPILIPDIHKEPLFLNRLARPDTDEQISFIAVPVNYQGKTYGVLAVDKAFSKLISITTDIEILKMIANMIASFLHKIDYFETQLSAVQEEKDKIEAKKLTLIEELRQKYNYKQLIGSGKLMEKVFEKISMVTRSSSSVLIRGESGTGKEVAAKTIHYCSDRASAPFITINCSAIPTDLIESEMFGYTKGAFNGAVVDKKGKFELADGGTIFLDEIADMPIESQSKLLRVLQEKTIDKIGTDTPVKVDVRIIAASNKSLEEAVQTGKFRLDLYYRLNVFTIDMPPLRKRKEDLPELCEHIVTCLNSTYSKHFLIEATTITQLMKCSWPGNIRELENCLERAAFAAKDGLIKPEHISCMRGEMCLAHVLDCADTPDLLDIETGKSDDDNSDKASVISALEKSGWVQAKAARVLNMTVRQINYRIQKYKISVKKI